jgi:hypothetical protein
MNLPDRGAEFCKDGQEFVPGVPWPGYGHIAKVGEGFHYYPEPMQIVL